MCPFDVFDPASCKIHLHVSRQACSVSLQHSICDYGNQSIDPLAYNVMQHVLVKTFQRPGFKLEAWCSVHVLMLVMLPGRPLLSLGDGLQSQYNYPYASDYFTKGNGYLPAWPLEAACQVLARPDLNTSSDAELLSSLAGLHCTSPLVVPQLLACLDCASLKLQKLVSLASMDLMAELIWRHYAQCR